MRGRIEKDRPPPSVQLCFCSIFIIGHDSLKTKIYFSRNLLLKKPFFDEYLTTYMHMYFNKGEKILTESVRPPSLAAPRNTERERTLPQGAHPRGGGITEWLKEVAVSYIFILYVFFSKTNLILELDNNKSCLISFCILEKYTKWVNNRSSLWLREMMTYRNVMHL